MAVKCISVKWNYDMYCNVHRFIVDSEADVADLPPCNPSSVAIVAEGGKAFVVNASGNWVECGVVAPSLAEEAMF